MKNASKIIIAVILTVVLVSVTALADVTGIVTADILNVRSLPTMDSDIIGQLKNGDSVTISETADNWHKITYGDASAFISGDYISSVTNKSSDGVVTADILNIRSFPSTDAGIVGQLKSGDPVSVTEAKDNWYQIKCGFGSAFICADYVSLNSEPNYVEQFSAIPDLNNPSSLSKGEMLVEYAKKFIGTPYVYGGMSPSGFDCSGFVKFCYAYMGVNINRISYDQAKNGYEVSRDNMQPGDILCFASSVGGNYIGHTGIYVGNGQFIHSPREGYSIEIIPLTTGTYSQRLTNIRRIFN